MRSTRLTDMALYLLISLAVLGIIFAATALNLPSQTFLRELNAFGFSLLILAQLVGSSRNKWRVRSFWIFMGVTLLLQFILTTAIVILHFTITSPQWMLAAFCEFLFLQEIKNRFLRYAAR